MSKLKYLLVDDEDDIPGLKRRVESVSGVELHWKRPHADWTEQVEEIHEAMSKDCCGLLIDFRLDEGHDGTATLDKKGNKVRYTAESLVAELRRRSMEGGKDESYPIILWSTATFLKEFFEVFASQKLSYDEIWEKEKVRTDLPRYARQLPSLANGYRLLAESIVKKRFDMRTLLAAPDLPILREFDQFVQKRTRGAPYAFQLAQFIWHDVIGATGPLVDTDTVHAFLGLEPLKPRALEQVLAGLGEDIVYRGTFSDSQVRYWRQPLVDALEHATGAKSWLSLPAAERVTALEKKFRRTKLVAAKPLHPSYATDYDCICAETRRPLAKRNAYRLIDSRPLPWKEASLVAGVEYRKRYEELRKTKPLEAEDMDRFCVQFDVPN